LSHREFRQARFCLCGDEAKATAQLRRSIVEIAHYFPTNYASCYVGGPWADGLLGYALLFALAAVALREAWVGASVDATIWSTASTTVALAVQWHLSTNERWDVKVAAARELYLKTMVVDDVTRSTYDQILASHPSVWRFCRAKPIP
jgi:hypothetical protein